MLSSAPAVLVATLLAALVSTGAAASGSTFVPAENGMSCSSICSAQGLVSATLRSSDSPMQTSVCEANVTGHGRLSGYQEGGKSTCNVVSNGTASALSEYSCLCLKSQAQPGLVASKDSTPCSTACNQGFGGLTGSAVGTDSSQPSYTCLPSSEIGHTNRFGFTTDLSGDTSICTAAVGGSAMATPDFSCFCVFQSGSSGSPTPSTKSSPRSSSSDLSSGTDAVSVGG